MIGKYDLPRIGLLVAERPATTLDHFLNLTPRIDAYILQTSPPPLTTNDAPQGRPSGCCRASCVGGLTHARAGWENPQVQSMTS